MNQNDIQKLLEKYNIQSVEELEYYLNEDASADECMDDNEEKNCTNSQCYEDTFVPDCRKIIEIYTKYFKSDIHKKKDFIAYLEQHTQKSRSSLENYLSCKSCNQQMQKSINHSIKISDYDFKKDFCTNLDIKFNYVTLFETDYPSVKKFLFKEHKITRDTFKASIRSEEQTITKEEEQRVFDLTQVSKEQLKANLSQRQNLEGSIYFKLNLAQAAFERHLVEESYSLIEELSKEEALQNNGDFLQLKAKILSNKKRDKEAIVLLEALVKRTKPNINAETYNLLAASIKREAFREFELYGDEARLCTEMCRAKEIYLAVYKLNNDYYPLLNFMYLELMLLYMQQKSPEEMAQKREEFTQLWSTLKHKVNDWWSYIATVEYLMLIGQYTEAKEELLHTKEELEALEVNAFNLHSTLRQLELYAQFCTDEALKENIAFIKTISREHTH